MKIATASSIISDIHVRNDVAKSLGAGEQVSIVATPSNSPHPPELAQEIHAGRAVYATIDERSRSQLNIPGLLVGGAAGTVAGAGIGMILDQLKAVHPSSAPAFDVACALVGMALGSAAGSNLLKVKLGFSVKDGRVHEV